MARFNPTDVQKKKITYILTQEIQFQYGQRQKLYAKPNTPVDPYKQAISCKRTIETLKKVKKFIQQAV
ncbi:MAG: hypothetical protein WC422_04395 [Candidatus Paceibacterota bacterium]|jgi:hypothetical protein